MMHRFRFSLILVCIAALGIWIGSGIFNYFTHQSPPIFSLVNIENDGFYTQQHTASVTAHNDYKIANITIMIDGKEFLNNNIRSKNFELPFTIDTTTLAEGPHTFDITAVDSSYHGNKSEAHLTFNVDNTPMRVALLTQECTADQGRTMHLKVQANKRLGETTVKLFNKTHSFAAEAEGSFVYECFIPVDCEERPNEHLVTIDVQDMVKNTQKLPCKVAIRGFEFKKQRGFNVSSEKLESERATSVDDKVLREALGKWVLESSKKKLWSGAFEYPIQVQRMTTPFGEIRMNPDRGRYMHKGIDLINRPKCVVWASQTGKVIIKDQFTLYGNTVVLDHGLGVFTLYAHLDSFANIEVGDTINKGNAVGKLGMTGYASGYHLHWELLVNNVGVDPVEWTSKVF